MAELHWDPCPFCGCTDIHHTRHQGAGRGMWHRGQDLFSVGCYGCGASVPARYSVDLVNAAWNMRPSALMDAGPLGHATRLATSMWRKHYQQDAPNWKPCPDLPGVLSQIDNMLTGLVRSPDESQRKESHDGPGN